MPYVLVRQRTGDFARWKKVFDEFEPLRRQAGCTSSLLLRDTTDPHNLVILFQFEELDRAKAYIENPNLETAWSKAAVEGPTEIDLLMAPHE